MYYGCIMSCNQEYTLDVIYKLKITFYISLDDFWLDSSNSQSIVIMILIHDLDAHNKENNNTVAIGNILCYYCKLL
jgi:hypothetical protein